MYHDSFSCRIALVARAFRGAAALPLSAPFPSSALAGRITSDRSLTMSNVRGFSRWNSSSKYTVGMVDSGGGPCVDLRIKPALGLRTGPWPSFEFIDESDAVEPLRVGRGFGPGRKYPSPLDSVGVSCRSERCSLSSSSLSFNRCSWSYSAPTLDKYGLNS